MFKEGQTVYCIVFGKGVIEKIDPESKDLHIQVRFHNHYSEFYTEDGKMWEEGNRCLFFSEPKIDALTSPPFEPALVGKYIIYKQTHYGGAASYSIGFVLNEDENNVYVTNPMGPRHVPKSLPYTVLDEAQLPK